MIIKRILGIALLVTKSQTTFAIYPDTISIQYTEHMLDHYCPHTEYKTVEIIQINPSFALNLLRMPTCEFECIEDFHVDLLETILLHTPSKIYSILVGILKSAMSPRDGVDKLLSLEGMRDQGEDRNIYIQIISESCRKSASVQTFWESISNQIMLRCQQRDKGSSLQPGQMSQNDDGNEPRESQNRISETFSNSRPEPTSHTSPSTTASFYAATLACGAAEELQKIQLKADSSSLSYQDSVIESLISQLHKRPSLWNFTKRTIDVDVNADAVAAAYAVADANADHNADQDQPTPTPTLDNCPAIYEGYKLLSDAYHNDDDEDQDQVAVAAAYADQPTPTDHAADEDHAAVADDVAFLMCYSIMVSRTEWHASLQIPQWKKNVFLRLYYLNLERKEEAERLAFLIQDILEHPFISASRSLSFESRSPEDFKDLKDSINFDFDDFDDFTRSSEDLGLVNLEEGLVEDSDLEDSNLDIKKVKKVIIGNINRIRGRKMENRMEHKSIQETLKSSLFKLGIDLQIYLKKKEGAGTDDACQTIMNKPWIWDENRFDSHHCKKAREELTGPCGPSKQTINPAKLFRLDDKLAAQNVRTVNYWRCAIETMTEMHWIKQQMPLTDFRFDYVANIRRSDVASQEWYIQYLVAMHLAPPGALVTHYRLPQANKELRLTTTGSGLEIEFVEEDFNPITEDNTRQAAIADMMNKFYIRSSLVIDADSINALYKKTNKFGKLCKAYIKRNESKGFEIEGRLEELQSRSRKCRPWSM